MRNFLSRFAAELGASAAEYALIASFMAVLIILPVTLVGDYLTDVFDTIATALSRVAP